MSISFQRRFGLLFLLSGTGFLLSFGNLLVVSYHFGSSLALDSYWALLAIANFLLFYVQPLREALIPLVYTPADADREHSGALFFAGIAAQAALALVSMTLLLVLVQTKMLALMGVDQSVSADLWLGFLVYFIIHGLAETCNGLLLAMNRVVYQALVRLASALLAFSCLWLLAGRIGVLALLLSLLVAQCVLLLLSIVGLKKEGFRLVWRGFTPLWQDTRFRSVFFALIFNYFLTQVYVVYERIVMLRLMSGLVASYQYSVSMINVLISLLAFPLANLLWPYFISQVERGAGGDAVLYTAARVVAPLSLVLIACCVFLERFSPEIVQLLLARGAFDEASKFQTIQALQATVFAAVPFSLMTIFGKVLLSQGRGKAMAAGGSATALSGMAVVMLAGELDSVRLVQWHWAIGNAVGLCTIVFSLLRHTSRPAYLVRTALLWLMRTVVVVFLAIWVTPSVADPISTLGVLTGLVFSFAVFGACVLALAQLFGVLKMHQILGLQR